jgi:hypothetical protein
VYGFVDHFRHFLIAFNPPASFLDNPGWRQSSPNHILKPAHVTVCSLLLAIELPAPLSK